MQLLPVDTNMDNKAGIIDSRRLKEAELKGDLFTYLLLLLCENGNIRNNEKCFGGQDSNINDILSHVNMNENNDQNMEGENIVLQKELSGTIVEDMDQPSELVDISKDTETDNKSTIKIGEDSISGNKAKLYIHLPDDVSPEEHPELRDLNMKKTTFHGYIEQPIGKESAGQDKIYMDLSNFDNNTKNQNNTGNFNNTHPVEQNSFMKTMDVFTGVPQNLSITPVHGTGPVEAHNIVTNILQHFLQASPSRPQVARIRLEPPELGEITLHISIKDKQLKTFIEVNHHVVKHIIENNLNKLINDLSMYGFVVEQFVVDLKKDGDYSGYKDFNDWMKTHRNFKKDSDNLLEHSEDEVDNRALSIIV